MIRALLACAMMCGAAVPSLLAQPNEPTQPAAPAPPPPVSQFEPRIAGEVEMTPEQRTELEQRLNETWLALPLRERLQLLQYHRALNQMSPDERRFVQERFERFVHMNAVEREQIRINRERWRQMSHEDRERARQAYWRRWREQHPGQPLPPGRWFHRDRMGQPPTAPPLPSDPNNPETTEPPTNQEKP